MSVTPMQTPRRKQSLANNLSTPLFVPPSPQLKQLGYGTGTCEKKNTNILWFQVQPTCE